MKHLHHIIPRHMGGTDDPSNLVELTVEEHAEAHMKLYEQYGRWQDKLAWEGLAGMIGHEEAIARLNRLKSLGKKQTEETKAKRRLYKHTPEAKRKIAAANVRIHTGAKRSEEAKRRMSLKKLGNSNASGKRSPEAIARMKMAQQNRRLREMRHGV